MHPNANGLAEQLKCVYAAHSTATAGSTGDNTEVDGAALDINGDYQSLKVVIAYKAALASTETISFTANLQTADVQAFNDGSQADYGDALSKTAVAGDTGVTSATGVVELDFDLRGAKRWVRVQYTPDLSAGGTDTLAASAVYILGGSRVQPIGSRAN